MCIRHSTAHTQTNWSSLIEHTFKFKIEVVSCDSDIILSYIIVNVQKLWERTPSLRILEARERVNRLLVEARMLLQKEKEKPGKEMALEPAHTLKQGMCYVRSSRRLMKHTKNYRKAGWTMEIKFHQLSLPR